MVTNLGWMKQPGVSPLKARAFSYARPSTVMEALEAFADAGEEASYIAGGQSLVPALALRLQAPQLLIDIAHIEALRGVELQGDWLRIGALTRHCEVLTDPLIARHAPLLSRGGAARRASGDPQQRHDRRQRLALPILRRSFRR